VAAEKRRVCGDELEKHTAGAEQAAEKLLTLDQNRSTMRSRG
jgi:hypothetical protein